jgi:hypothetical protein
MTNKKMFENNQKKRSKAYVKLKPTYSSNIYNSLTLVAW